MSQADYHTNKNCLEDSSVFLTPSNQKYDIRNQKPNAFRKISYANKNIKKNVPFKMRSEK